MRLYLYIFLFLSIIINGQTIITPNFSIKNSPFEVKNYGVSSYNIYYKVNFMENALSENSKREVLCILEQGESLSKFFDYNQLRKDSLLNKYKDLPTIGAKEANEILKIPVLWKKVVFKNQGSITVQDRYKDTYQYEEAQPKFNWKLENEEKNIIGYKCKKATGQYRGRNYIAWYAEEIPINNGPYIFEGLPGLILEAEDLDQKFKFVAVGINKKSKPIYLRNEKSIIKTSREKFRNVQKTFYENPGAIFSGKAYNEDGSPIIIKQQNIQYEPMEID
ncbi:GLPGLI family protein [uncultured Chryseobacterium sp.]|uniref:GLPGLI family protein n=1 Tax=uncultured Chryseobacterium sp. TaxID=259322 RepID=UPI0026185E51|nr:GLPGLI family protein [uncultured Chryseobacterium sp.]